jgi:hypothetical protein
MSFLSSFQPLQIPLLQEFGFDPVGLFLGQGAQALEVVVGRASSEPTQAALTKLWKERLDHRPIPLLVVLLYGEEAALIGPSGEEPPIHKGIDPDFVESVCAKALRLPDRHSADRFIWSVLPELKSKVPGLRNEGVFATHELVHGVPTRSDWQQAAQQAERVLDKEGDDILKTLGYEIVRMRGPFSVLRHAGKKRSLALFLNQAESPEAANERFSGRTPVAQALSMAEQENLDYLIIVRGRALRLYPVDSAQGVGSKGMTNTYIEIDLDLLTPEKAAYLWLIFSGEALTEEGSFRDILERSRDFAASLSERLRKRIYDEVIPLLAEGIARARFSGQTVTAEALDITYRMALTLLFRLLFIAYAEDKELLPYRTNELYRKHSLKEIAHELVDIAGSGGQFSPGTVYWRGVWDLFDAVKEGKAEWGVPCYNGGLFSSDEKESPIGALLTQISLSDEDFGKVLMHLFVDDSPEGVGPVDFRSLGVREFGTIYEGLLESELSVAEMDLTTDNDGYYEPAQGSAKVVVQAGEVYLHNASGKRKASGTYFTKAFAVDHLLDHALETALDAHIQRLTAMDPPEAGAAFFDFRVADIAMGSGHFLVAAVDRIEKRLSNFLSDRPLPAVMAELTRLRKTAEERMEALGEACEIEDNQLLRRQIARHCIFGVDLNSMAVDLAKLSIWIHTFVPGLPLSLLDFNLVPGNSLVGIATIQEALEIMSGGEALSLFSYGAEQFLGAVKDPINQFGKIADANSAEIAEAKRIYHEAQEALKAPAALFDILAAARMNEDLNALVGSGQAITWLQKMADMPESELHQIAQEELAAVPPFHFPIAFPQVFLRENPGFDVILGNPPWEEIKPEEHRFWFRYVPGIRSMSQRARRQILEEMYQNRPDLVARFHQYEGEMELVAKAVKSGDYPGMETGDPDLYKGFIWRFWHLLRDHTGAMGVVLPRSVFNAKGAAIFRQSVLQTGKIIDLTFLLNNQEWVFEEVHPQYTIALFSMQKRKPTEETQVPLKGPFRSLSRYQTYKDDDPTCFSISEIMGWTDTAALPLLPSDESAPVFAQLRKAPRLDMDQEGHWRARPKRELDATNDKIWDHGGRTYSLMLFTEDQPKGTWPIFKGESFDVWVSDTGTYYAWGKPKIVKKRLQAKREWGQRNRRSAFSEFSAEWVQDDETMSCNYPRIAFRNIARATDSRTFRTALVPPKVFLSNAAPYFLWPRGDEKDQAYLLGVLSSIPLDWYARRFVEVNMNFHILNPFPIPRPDRGNPLWQRAVALAGRLAAPDERFADWAAAVGVDWGPLTQEEKDAMIHELDAVVAHLYGLSAEQLSQIFETFHEGWDYQMRLDATLVHYHDWEGRL